MDTPVTGRSTHYFYHRDTFHYVTGWAELDKHTFAFAGQVREHWVPISDGDDDLRYRVLVTLTPAQLRDAKNSWRRSGRFEPFEQFMGNAIGNFFTSGCRCEHDCCAHMQYYARVRRTKQREWVATVSGYRNI